MRLEITEIRKIVEKIGGGESGGMGLRYLMSLAEIFASQILSAVRANTLSVKSDDVKSLYIVLFRHFAVFDMQTAHPNVSRLLDHLYTKIENKSGLLSQIVEEYLISKDS